MCFASNSLYYIVSLHQTTTSASNDMNVIGCIISFLYIKPQPCLTCLVPWRCCIISFLYTKPQLLAQYLLPIRSCNISFLYIKPQRKAVQRHAESVVLYRFSTSNHNLLARQVYAHGVVLYRFSTSNHNSRSRRKSLPNNSVQYSLAATPSLLSTSPLFTFI